MANNTIGDIINLLHGDNTVAFDEGDLKLCDSPDGDGKWYSVMEVTPYGLRMSNDDIWEFSKLTQREINLVYKACKDVYITVLQSLQLKFR